MQQGVSVILSLFLNYILPLVTLIMKVTLVCIITGSQTGLPTPTGGDLKSNFACQQSQSLS